MANIVIADATKRVLGQQKQGKPKPAMSAMPKMMPKKQEAMPMMEEEPSMPPAMPPMMKTGMSEQMARRPGRRMELKNLRRASSMRKMHNGPES